MCIPDQPPSGLIPAAGLLHKSFPALVLSEYSERTQGGKRRKTAVNRHKRPSVGRRRAISELMVCFCALWERLLVRQQLAKLAYAIHKQSNIK
jgi:hypothetical protein